MKKLLFASILFSIAATTVDAACNTQSLKGAYIASGNYMGYVNNAPMSCGILARIVFNGDGTAEMNERETCAGAFVNGGQATHYSGNYVLNSDCVGGALFDTAVISMAFDKNLKNGQIIGGNTASGLSGTGTIIKQ